MPMCNQSTRICIVDVFLICTLKFMSKVHIYKVFCKKKSLNRILTSKEKEFVSFENKMEM